MRKLFFDTDGLDALATLPGLYERLQTVLAAGEATIYITHVQIDQTIVMADRQQTDEQRAKRNRLIALINTLPNVQHVPTAGFVVGLSRIGAAALDDDLADEIANGPAFARNPRNREDVLLIHTAAKLGAEFVGVDGPARKYALDRGLTTWSPAELLATL